MNASVSPLFAALSALCLGGVTNVRGQSEVTPETALAAAPKGFYVQEYRVEGVKTLNAEEIGAAVYPFLGPERTTDDIEQARAALEKAYHNKGYQTVTVEFPQQKVVRGIVRLNVVEAKVGRLRVKGARFFLPEDIKRRIPALAQGTVPNFNQVTREFVALNTHPDLRLTSPSVRPGVEPGTVDIDLNVKDTFPLHGSVELNNRASPDTTDLRLNGSLSYNNLWQRGHSVGASFQVSPQDLNEVEVLSGYYIARFPKIDWLSILLSGTKQNSNISTLGEVAVAGRGEILGARALINLPPKKNFYHSLSVGLDYKHFQQLITVPGSAVPIETPVTYYPFNLTYNAGWTGQRSQTDLSAGVTLHTRGVGERRTSFDNNRYRADSNFIYLRGDVAHTQQLAKGFEVMAKVQGQISDQPLLSGEQISGGGLGTVRGYLEAEAVGDNGIFGSLELRSPSLLAWLGEKAGEWRVYGFVEGGLLTLRSPLPEQADSFKLASVGIGSRLRLLDHLGGSLDLGFPLVSQAKSQAYDPRVMFRVWADF